MRQVGFGGARARRRARSRLGADASSAPARRGCVPSCSSVAAQRSASARRPPHALARLVERAHRVELASARWRSVQLGRGAPRRASDRRAGVAARARAPRLPPRAARPRRRARARSTSAACAALASAARRLRLHRLARVEQPALRGRSADRRRRAARSRCARSTRAPSCRGRPERAAPPRPPALDGDLLRLRASRSASSAARAAAARSRRSPFPAGAARPGSGDRGGSAGDRHVDARPSPRRRSSAARSLVGALAQLLDLALGREDAARLGAPPPRPVRPRKTSPSSVATVTARRRAARLAAPRSPSATSRGQHRGSASAATDPGRDDVGERRHAGVAGARAGFGSCRAVGRSPITNPTRPASASPTQPQAGGGVLVRRDDDVLQQIAETRLDGALVAASTSR